MTIEESNKIIAQQAEEKLAGLLKRVLQDIKENYPDGEGIYWMAKLGDSIKLYYNALSLGFVGPEDIDDRSRLYRMLGQNISKIYRNWKFAVISWGKDDDVDRVISLLERYPQKTIYCSIYVIESCNIYDIEELMSSLIKYTISVKSTGFYQIMKLQDVLQTPYSKKLGKNLVDIVCNSDLNTFKQNLKVALSEDRGHKVAYVQMNTRSSWNIGEYKVSAPNRLGYIVTIQV